MYTHTINIITKISYSYVQYAFLNTVNTTVACIFASGLLKLMYFLDTFPSGQKCPDK